MSDRAEPVEEAPIADLSVVIPAVNGCDILLETLYAVYRQEGDVNLQVVIPARNGEPVLRAVFDRYPSAVVLPVDPNTSIPAMRRLGFLAATGRIVAVIEDHVIVPPTWARDMVQAVARHGGAVGGPVENGATERILDRVAFMTEYGQMARNASEGRVRALPGNNVGYPRDVIRRFRDVIAKDRWEDALHGSLHAAGVPLMYRAELGVEHQMRYRSVAEYASQRFLYSRTFADLRLTDSGKARRLGYGAAALLLPGLVLIRTLRNLLGTRGSRRDAILGLPYLLVFSLAWGLGEAAGAVLGAGNAPGRVR